MYIWVAQPKATLSLNVMRAPWQLEKEEYLRGEKTMEYSKKNLIYDKMQSKMNQWGRKDGRTFDGT